MNTFKEQLSQGEKLMGSLLTLPSPDIAEIFANIGFDWLWVELEHSVMNLQTAQEMVRACGKTPCVVRAPVNDQTWLKRILDIGCSGVVIPQIKTAEEAETALKACKYPPEGERSLGLGRAQGYGHSLTPYLEHANQEITVILQIEHITGVQNIEKILQVPGIDCIFIGPYDLSASMNLSGNLEHPKVKTAINQIKEACIKQQVPMGIFVSNPEDVAKLCQQGFTLIALQTDAMFLWKSAKDCLERLNR